jgi:hypothetical protein
MLPSPFPIVPRSPNDELPVVWATNCTLNMIFVLQRPISICLLTSIMGFADLSIAEIAADHYIPLEKVLSVSQQPGISSSKRQSARLALEDVKAIISHILSVTRPKGSNDSCWCYRS